MCIVGRSDVTEYEFSQFRDLPITFTRTSVTFVQGNRIIIDQTRARLMTSSYNARNKLYKLQVMGCGESPDFPILDRRESEWLRMVQKSTSRGGPRASYTMPNVRVNRDMVIILAGIPWSFESTSSRKGETTRDCTRFTPTDGLVTRVLVRAAATDQSFALSPVVADDRHRPSRPSSDLHIVSRGACHYFHKSSPHKTFIASSKGGACSPPTIAQTVQPGPCLRLFLELVTPLERRPEPDPNTIRPYQSWHSAIHPSKWCPVAKFSSTLTRNRCFSGIWHMSERVSLAEQ
ncbi:hypothetical protein RRG08_037065 [Elysia crispata]|uniref:Uncharacterized protein n=1 Tax=Elysia crispata TaxID=231223 RepID=A0AAE0ZVS1_9GAST|nr:hypothetical protein RRG08_037065 [Elysia crispata]